MSYKHWPPLANVIGHAIDGFAEGTGKQNTIRDVLFALEVVRHEVTQAWIDSGVDLPPHWIVPPKPPKENT